MVSSDDAGGTTTEDRDGSLRDQDGDAEAAEDAALRATLESGVTDRRFCLETTAPNPRNVTCYGSSSSKTPRRYLEEARLLGYILAKRGHVCINGAGSFGCMAAMNDGVHAGEGHVRGVIHEMFLVDNGYFDIDPKTQTRLMRRGSSHRVFENAVILDREEQNERHRRRQNERRQRAEEQPVEQRGKTDGRTGQDTEKKAGGKKPGPVREILVAGTYRAHERGRQSWEDDDSSSAVSQYSS